MHCFFPFLESRYFEAVMKSDSSTTTPIKQTLPGLLTPVGSTTAISTGFLPGTEPIQGRIFNSLEQLESIRASHPVFAPEIPAHTLETWEKSLLALVRETSEEKLICIYNFSDQDKVAWINEQDGTYTDLLTGVQRDAQAVEIPAFGFIWLMHTK